MKQLRKVASAIKRRLDLGQYRKRGAKNHYAGNLFDRFSGLEMVLPHAKGATVLDFGCCEGLIAYEFARAGCSVVHGFDIDGPLMVFAQQLFRNVPVKSAFIQEDLSMSFDAFRRKHASVLLDRYDIVLFLGVYHHLENQTSPERLRGIVDGLLDKAGTYFVARTGRLSAFEQQIFDKGFEFVGEQPADVTGLLRVYKRKG